MTELELRQKVAAKIVTWIGLKASDRSNQIILNLYNDHKPLARGYAIKQGDAWCAATVSAVAIYLHLTDIMPTEVSCPQMIALYQQHKLSRWEENDNYIPKIGDIIMYDWQDSGSGDNKGTADHVGIVTNVNGSTITVTEGNMGGVVGQRTLQIGGKYIRGYCLPNYSWKAAQSQQSEPQIAYPDRWQTINDVPDGYYRQQVKRLMDRGVIAGEDGKLDLTKDMLRTLLMAERLK